MASHRETDEDYGKILLQFGPKDRLIEDADSIQWILQAKKGKEWRSVRFFTSREGVLRRVREYGFPVGDLNDFPDRFEPIVDGRRAGE